MKIVTLAALAALAAAPALAQTAQPAQPAQPTAAAAGKISVSETAIGDIIKNPQAKAALEKAFPEIPQYYDQISTMTLTQVQPMSGGRITDDNLKALQAEFDKLK